MEELKNIFICPQIIYRMLAKTNMWGLQFISTPCVFDSRRAYQLQLSGNQCNVQRRVECSSLFSRWSGIPNVPSQAPEIFPDLSWSQHWSDAILIAVIIWTETRKGTSMPSVSLVKWTSLRASGGLLRRVKWTGVRTRSGSSHPLNWTGVRTRCGSHHRVKWTGLRRRSLHKVKWTGWRASSGSLRRVEWTSLIEGERWIPSSDKVTRR